MALAALKTWIHEILTHQDINAEFAHIRDNALPLISPLTGDLSAGTNDITDLASVTFSESGTPLTIGQFRRNGLNLLFHDGVASRTVLTTGRELVALKTADESLSFDVTLQNDNELFFFNVPVGIYDMQLQLFYACSVASGAINVKFLLPGASTMLWYVSTSGASPLVSNQTEQISIQGAGSPGPVLGARFFGTVIIPSIGDIHVQWTQSVSDVVATVVYTGSSLQLRRLN
jgi:hypothetical protein